MTYGCMVAAVKNSPPKSWLRWGLVGGSVLYAPLACGSVRIDDVAAARHHGGMRPITFMLDLKANE